MKKAIVIDGNSLVYRSYYATWKLVDYYKNKGMQPVNALKLFTLSLLKLLDQKHYDYAFVAFDHQKKTFRNEMMEAYKANRKKTPDDLLSQLPLIKETIESLGIKWMSKQDYEADDLVGSFAKLCANNNCECDVFSSDKDMLQLVGENIKVYLLKTGISELIEYNHENFSQLMFGLQPKQIIDYKAIVGDGSDNFIGIKGVGQKSAINLLLKYKTFEEIYNHLDELSEKQAQLFTECKKNGELCYSIASINTGLFNNMELEIFIKNNIDDQKFRKIIGTYRFSGFDKWIK